MLVLMLVQQMFQLGVSILKWWGGLRLIESVFSIDTQSIMILSIPTIEYVKELDFKTALFRFPHVYLPRNAVFQYIECIGLR